MCRAVPLLVLLLASTVRADSLDEVERKELRAYLSDLKSGRPGSAATVERLAGVSFAGLLDTMKSYVSLAHPTEPHPHRAYQGLSERISREAHSPWPLLQLYSPEFGRFLTQPSDLSHELFRRLLGSDNGRLSVDLCVRLAPSVSLEHLASGKKQKRTELFDAWNRRLALSRESRPLPDLDGVLTKIAGAFSLPTLAPELEAPLRFRGSWPTLRDTYRRELDRCLKHDNAQIVLAGLAVQHRLPTLVERNEMLIERWKDNARV